MRIKTIKNVCLLLFFNLHCNFAFGENLVDSIPPCEQNNINNIVDPYLIQLKPLVYDWYSSPKGILEKHTDISICKLPIHLGILRKVLPRFLQDSYGIFQISLSRDKEEIAKNWLLKKYKDIETHLIQVSVSWKMPPRRSSLFMPQESPVSDIFYVRLWRNIPIRVKFNLTYSIQNETEEIETSFQLLRWIDQTDIDNAYEYR